jgi:hypothetical protein
VGKSLPVPAGDAEEGVEGEGDCPKNGGPEAGAGAETTAKFNQSSETVSRKRTDNHPVEKTYLEPLQSCREQKLQKQTRTEKEVHQATGQN